MLVVASQCTFEAAPPTRDGQSQSTRDTTLRDYVRYYIRYVASRYANMELMTMSSATTSGELCLEWKNLDYQVPAHEQTNYSFWQLCHKVKELRILRNASGHMTTGDLVAVLGCSGAGKTTLLAAISQRLRGNLSGQVALNGMAVDRCQMTRISSFLPQYEIHVKTLTAVEHLYFMSHFKMHRQATTLQKRQRVGDLLRVVGLRDAANTRIMQLSGGERKRLSLAEELITDPPFLFCDEPTTGLDSYNAYTVVKTLRHLCTQQIAPRNTVYATDSSSSSLSSSLSSTSSSSSSSPTPIGERGGHESIDIELMHSMDEPLIKTTSDIVHRGSMHHGRHKKSIICSIHQPSSEVFELFSHVILMDAGTIIFQGSTEKARQFFTELGYLIPKNCNPADFYLKTVSDSHTMNKDGERVKSIYDLETSGLYTGTWLMKRKYGGDYLNNLKTFKKIPWIYQVYLLLLRFMTDERRNFKRGLMALSFFMITSVTLATMYSGVAGFTQKSVQDITGSIFMLSNEIIFTFSYSVTYVFPMSLPIMRREIGEGTYSLSAYYVAVVLSFIPDALFKSYLFFAVVYGAIYRQLGFALYLSMGLVLSLSAMAATAYGLFLSSLFETDKMASECAAPFDLLFLIFGGAYYNVDSVPLLKYISLFFYANEALMYNFWINIGNIVCDDNEDRVCISNGIEVLEHNSLKTASYTYWLDCVGLVAIAVVFNAVAYTFIRKYVKRSGYY